MQTRYLVLTTLLATLALPMAAQAQGTVRGAQEGAAQGNRDAGPVGAVVGGALGAVAGTVGGILGVEDRPRFRDYVVRERLPSYRYDERLPRRRGAAGKRRHLLRDSRRIPRARATATPT